MATSRGKAKKPVRRLGVESSENRAQLISLASRLIRDEGCAAVTARRLAEELGLKRQIVHYYFGTIEDLLIAVIRRNIDKLHERIKQDLDSDEPLRVIYRIGNSVTSTVFEFSAMAMRNKAIKAEMQRYLDAFRQIQAQAIERHLERRGITPRTSASATALIINSIAHTLAIEAALGATAGHAETQALLEEWLDAFAQHGEWLTLEPTPRPKVRAAASRRK
jgi:AcrR family transcriptional regulator